MEENEELAKVQREEGIKLVYIGIVQKAQELAGNLKVDTFSFKDDKEGVEILKEYGDKLSDLVKELSLHIANL